MSPRTITRMRQEMIRETEEYLNRHLRRPSASDWPVGRQPTRVAANSRPLPIPSPSDTAFSAMRWNRRFPGHRVLRWVVEAIRLMSLHRRSQASFDGIDF